MTNNLPDGCRDNDPTAPWNGREEETKTCHICGGLMYDNGDTFEQDFICEDCGADYSQLNVALCGYCGDHLPKIKTHGTKYRAECECGLCTPFCDTQSECLDMWKQIN